MDVGRETVYTDSEGRFRARLQKDAPVPVALRPADFLTGQTYTALSKAVTVTPERGEAHPVELRAAICRVPVAEPPAELSGERPDENRSGRMARGLHVLVVLGKRMLHVWGRS